MHSFFNLSSIIIITTSGLYDPRCYTASLKFFRAVAECSCTSLLWGCRLRAFSTSLMPPLLAIARRFMSSSARFAMAAHPCSWMPTWVS